MSSSRGWDGVGVAAISVALAVPAAGQIVTNQNSYSCGSSFSQSCRFSRTHNLSLDVTVRSITCARPTSLGHLYDLSDDPGLEGEYTTLKCVDFSIWSSENPDGQEIFIRVYQDLTPEDNAPNAPEAGACCSLLLADESFVLPPSLEGVASSDPVVSPGRSDGDISHEVYGIDGGGILLPPNAVILVEVGHLGEARTRFGTNQAGEIGDAAQDSRRTWLRSPGCAGAPTDWVIHDTIFGDRDFVQQIQFDLGDTTTPTCLCGPRCDQFDFTSSRPGVPDGIVGVDEFLQVLAEWGPAPESGKGADIYPFNCCGTNVDGDGVIDINDLLFQLSSWGPCPWSGDECRSLFDTLVSRVRLGTFAWDNTDASEFDSAPPRPNLGIGAYCGFDPDEGGDVFGPGDIWFHFSASCGGLVTLSTDESEGIQDTILEVWPIDRLCRSFDFADLIACNDDISPENRLSELTFETAAAKRYLIRLAGRNGERGSGILRIDISGNGQDCNGNGISDDCDIKLRNDRDCNRNGLPDECDIPADITGDGVVGIEDFLALLAAWGPCPGCPEDIDDDAFVGVWDFLMVLANWG